MESDLELRQRQLAAGEDNARGTGLPTKGP